MAPSSLVQVKISTHDIPRETRDNGSFVPAAHAQEEEEAAIEIVYKEKSKLSRAFSKFGKIWTPGRKQKNRYPAPPKSQRAPAMEKPLFEHEEEEEEDHESVETLKHLEEALQDDQRDDDDEEDDDAVTEHATILEQEETPFLCGALIPEPMHQQDTSCKEETAVSNQQPEDTSTASPSSTKAHDSSNTLESSFLCGAFDEPTPEEEDNGIKDEKNDITSCLEKDKAGQEAANHERGMMSDSNSLVEDDGCHGVLPTEHGCMGDCTYYLPGAAMILQRNRIDHDEMDDILATHIQETRREPHINHKNKSGTTTTTTDMVATLKKNHLRRATAGDDQPMDLQSTNLTFHSIDYACAPNYGTVGLMDDDDKTSPVFLVKAELPLPKSAKTQKKKRQMHVSKYSVSTMSEGVSVDTSAGSRDDDTYTSASSSDAGSFAATSYAATSVASQTEATSVSSYPYSAAGRGRGNPFGHYENQDTQYTGASSYESDAFKTMDGDRNDWESRTEGETHYEDDDDEVPVQRPPSSPRRPRRTRPSLRW